MAADQAKLSEDTRIPIEVAYALPDEQAVFSLEVPAGCSVKAAIQRSGVLEAYPQIDLSTDSVGIFAVLVGLDEPVSAHDRIEIYRPLQIDPKAQRRERAQRQRAAASKGGAA